MDHVSGEFGQEGSGGTTLRVSISGTADLNRCTRRLTTTDPSMVARRAVHATSCQTQTDRYMPRKAHNARLTSTPLKLTS